MSESASAPAQFASLIDEAAALPPSSANLLAVSLGLSELRRSSQVFGQLYGNLVVLDTDLPLLRGSTLPIHVVLSGGAGQVAGPAGLCRRLGLDLQGLTVGLRDLDDLAANTRRVVAAVDDARASGDLDEEAQVAVEIPEDASNWGWRAALDEVAAAELHLSLRLAGTFGGPAPSVSTVARWIDAALDAETPFRVHGLAGAVRRDGDAGPEHGLVNVLAATRAAWDGDGSDAVTAILDERSPSVLGALVGSEAASARRWLQSAACLSAPAVADELRDLGLPLAD